MERGPLPYGAALLSMVEKRGEFSESHAPAPRETLLKQRIGDLELKLKGTRLERIVERLYEELQKAGLSAFRPPVYLSDEWGCPDRVPVVGVPFYLADANLLKLEDEVMEGIEAESDDQIMKYLRHEAGHAFNYAYRLFETPEWTAMFGPFSRPYTEEYTPSPFSRSFVRHLPAWYAQKHPDEDFAETFAVWLDPESKWQKVYAEWRCLPKLLYIDELSKRLGSQPPPVNGDNYDMQEDFLASTVGEHYDRQKPGKIEIPPLFDSALRDIFPAASVTVEAPDGKKDAEESAAEFLKKHRRTIVSRVFYWTGLNDRMIRALAMHLEQRCEALNLAVGKDRNERLIEVIAFITALCMNRLHTGEFISR
ncbi:MAG TPA: hypothetical protein VNT79_10095 [Phycisphaerae bacterium]|nr:hypothetical protein [Phycisphaerae bacterium]